MTDDLEWSQPVDDPTRPERPHRRHVWMPVFDTEALDGVTVFVSPRASGQVCMGCGKLKDEAASRRGRTSRQRGNAQEREWCKRLGLTRVGHFGGAEDGRNALFVGQAKSLATGRFPSWMSNELDKLPRDQGRIPVLGILETPGPGRTPRRLLVIEERDWIALHGGGK